jgi:hypothetical protein
MFQTAEASLPQIPKKRTKNGWGVDEDSLRRGERS